MNETIDQWVTRIADSLTWEWTALIEHHAGTRAPDGLVLVDPHGVRTPHGDALLAHLDEVIAGLNTDVKHVLCDNRLPSLGRKDGSAFNDLLGYQLVRWIPATQGGGKELTSKGRAVVRRMEDTRG